MTVALLTPYLTPYREPLFKLLADRHGVEVLCYGGGERYVPSWFTDLDAQLAAAPFPARRLRGAREALALGRAYEALIAPPAGAILPAAYVGARRRRRTFVLWASLWAQPRSPVHALTLPLTRHIYREADVVVAYGEHVRRFVAGIRGRDDDVFVAPQSVEAELFGRKVAEEEVERFRAEHALPEGPLVLYVGRFVVAKGIEVLLDAWAQVSPEATLVLIGDGPLGSRAASFPRVRVLAPLPRGALPVAYAAATCVVVPSIPTPRFKEPWGLVCNEAMHQGTPVIASDAVGAAAGGLVVDGRTGLVVPAGDAPALAAAVSTLLADGTLRARLAAAAREAVAAYNYDAAAAGFSAAFARARSVT